MIQHLITTWRAGWRSHSFRAISLLAVMLISISWLASSFSGRHPQTVSLDIGISGIRIISILLILFWSQELLGREIDRKTVLIALSHPTPRSSYLLGRYFGINAMLSLAIAILGIAVYLSVKLYNGTYVQANPVTFGGFYVLTLFFVLIDGMVVSAFVLMLSSLATTSLLPLVCGAVFAITARSYNQVLAYLTDNNSEAADIAHIYTPIINSISWIIPDLDKLDIRNTVLYGANPSSDSLIWPPIAAIAYTSLMLYFACKIFKRREFN